MLVPLIVKRMVLVLPPLEMPALKSKIGPKGMAFKAYILK
jgi:hypothetical protein